MTGSVEPTEEPAPKQPTIATTGAPQETQEIRTSLETLVDRLTFGFAAFGPLARSEIPSVEKVWPDMHKRIPHLVRESVPAAATMRGERGAKLVTQMLADCYMQGLFMHGGPSSPVNSEIIPAVRFIFSELAKLAPDHAKRVNLITMLTEACQDCQQVQAREIMRIYSDLTAQSETFVSQLKYSLVRAKETALDRFITDKHPKCDLDHTFVEPWQQRVHLTSGYVATIGAEFGLDGVVTAWSDRFLEPAVREIRQVARKEIKDLIEILRRDMSVKDWVKTLLADINNQSPHADRLINRNCIFKWVEENMNTEAAHGIFFDEERIHEFEEAEPKEPTKENRFQPFLSSRVLVDILKSANMLRERGEDQPPSRQKPKTAKKTK